MKLVFSASMAAWMGYCAALGVAHIAKGKCSGNPVEGIVIAAMTSLMFGACLLHVAGAVRAFRKELE